LGKILRIHVDIYKPFKLYKNHKCIQLAKIYVFFNFSNCFSYAAKPGLAIEHKIGTCFALISPADKAAEEHS
jgi:hypothetical protein